MTKVSDDEKRVEAEQEVKTKKIRTTERKHVSTKKVITAKEPLLQDVLSEGKKDLVQKDGGLKDNKDNRSVDSKLVPNKSVDSKSVDNKPIDNKPADNKSVDNKPADNKPADNQVVKNIQQESREKDPRSSQQESRESREKNTRYRHPQQRFSQSRSNQAQQQQTTSSMGVQGQQEQQSAQQQPVQQQNQSQQSSQQHNQQHNSSYSQQQSSQQQNQQQQQQNQHQGQSQGQQQQQQGGGGGRYNTSRSHTQQHSSSSSRQPSQHQETRKPLEEMFLVDLNSYARKLGIVGAALMSKQELVEKIKFVELHPDVEMEVNGALEKLPDGFGFLRSSHYDYVSSQDDIYVSPSQIRRFNLRTGDMITGVIRKPKEGEKYYALLQVKSVNGSDPITMGDRPNFDRLTPTHPYERLTLEFDPTAISTRILDIFTPIGKGQRGLIVAPPKVGKTLLMKEIAQSLIANYPDIYLMVLLIDERPEEVADMKKVVKGKMAEVVSSTFDETATRHVQVAEIVLERAKRLVESGKDVVILLDSITRLARAYNTVAPASGKVLTGGIDANALYFPKRFFGAARAVQEGGSLTILASALVDTGSRMEEVIFEEFKGTGNMEINMTRKLANRRVYPAFDLLVSGTRREDLLLSVEDLNKVWVLQKLLSTMNTIEGMEFIIDKMKKCKTNREFLESINKKPVSAS